MSHGWFQTAPFAWDRDAGVLDRVERLGGGAGDRVMRRERGGGVAVRPGAACGAPSAAPRRPRACARMLQLDADLDGLPDAVAAVDPALARDLAAYGGGRLLAGRARSSRTS